MDTAAHQIVSDYLDDLEHLLQHADAASVAVMAPAELERTIQTVRALLSGHSPAGQGRCPRCAPRWAWWRRALPCRAWQIAYQHTIAAPIAHPTGPILTSGGPR